MKKIIVSMAFSLLYISCLKEEIPVPAQPHIPGESQTSTVAMWNDYRYQVYFSLPENKAVGTNLKKAWDLGFEADEEGNRVFLNSAKSMFAVKTAHTDFSAVKDTLGYTDWKLDAITGNRDSTAIGEWSGGSIYIVDRGYDEKGRHQGFSKLKVHSSNALAFVIEHAELSAETTQYVVVLKNSDLSLVSFSFDNGVVDIEPEKTSWDLVFTQYTYVFEEEGNLPYIVAGVLLSRHETAAVEDTVHSFEEINLKVAKSAVFSSAINVPGYSWKTYDFDLSQYIVHTNRNYIIRTRDDNYYKLRFLDFYNEMGESGYPTFEFQRL